MKIKFFNRIKKRVKVRDKHRSMTPMHPTVQKAVDYAADTGLQVLRYGGFIPLYFTFEMMARKLREWDQSLLDKVIYLKRNPGKKSGDEELSSRPVEEFAEVDALRGSEVPQPDIVSEGEAATVPAEPEEAEERSTPEPLETETQTSPKTVGDLIAEEIAGIEGKSTSGENSYDEFENELINAETSDAVERKSRGIDPDKRMNGSLKLQRVRGN